jgi:hypothetical protein
MVKPIDFEALEKLLAELAKEQGTLAPLIGK